MFTVCMIERLDTALGGRVRNRICSRWCSGQRMSGETAYAANVRNSGDFCDRNGRQRRQTSDRPIGVSYVKENNRKASRRPRLRRLTGKNKSRESANLERS
jgi:hypothetical protein